MDIEVCFPSQIWGLTSLDAGRMLLRRRSWFAVLAEREGFYLPQISQVTDFRRHKLKYA